MLETRWGDEEDRVMSGQPCDACEEEERPGECPFCHGIGSVPDYVADPELYTQDIETPCPACMGNGTCSVCSGSGQIKEHRPSYDTYDAVDFEYVSCSACNGGSCPECGGSGHIYEPNYPSHPANDPTDVTCPKCKGTRTCASCKGAGYIDDDEDDVTAGDDEEPGEEDERVDEEDEQVDDDDRYGDDEDEDRR
jgi:DnaJ-class molecular chaperone